jgi:hypothetical protein
VIAVPLVGGPVEIRGAVRVDRTARGVLPRRLTAESERQLPDDFMRASVSQSAGIRIAFRTTATWVELTVLATKLIESEVAPMPPAHYELTIDGQLFQSRSSSAGNRLVFTFERPEAYLVAGEPDTLRFDSLPAGEKDIEIWLPYTDEVELLALRAEVPVTSPAPATGLRWLHHGSSISHGYVASSTGSTWPVAVARAARVELTNVAFSGNAMLDQLTARTMRDVPADFISLKIGINLVNADAMRMRVFRTAVHGFLDTIRDGHPLTPLLVISPIFCEPVEYAAGPTIQDPARADPWTTTAGTSEEVTDGKLSLHTIREELNRLVDERAEYDPAISYLDGLELYGTNDAETLPMPDNLHPGDDVQRLIAERFVERIFLRDEPAPAGLRSWDRRNGRGGIVRSGWRPLRRVQRR